ncbi:BA14K family protein [Bradyrhizobium iriomotense]|uniref:Lectin-like protein BA14k n=1 Tax=Bradyrhizobium iriomotense TaxID=441950 RepID=A0ABQ6B449_9BRAD|nr:BA14K family protein [Bradyrhizobium iriomotense]GLR88216.1 hypothetical protein GCM10007857_49280 [Bradyrhizobium iriomotense]
MNNLRVLSAAAALALVLPLATPSVSFAQSRVGGGGGHAIGGGGGGGHASFGGGGGARIGGGNFGGGAAAFRGGGGGGNFAAAGAVRPGVAAPAFSGGSRVVAGTPSGNWNGGNWHGGGWRHRGGGFWPGVAAGVAIGGLGSYAYYGGGPYYDDSYYNDDYYYDQGPGVAVVPDTGGDSAAYCAQRYRSYDPASGTYLGYDGLRHPCP